MLSLIIVTVNLRDHNFNDPVFLPRSQWELGLNRRYRFGDFKRANTEVRCVILRDSVEWYMLGMPLRGRNIQVKFSHVIMSYQEISDFTAGANEMTSASKYRTENIGADRKFVEECRYHKSRGLSFHPALGYDTFRGKAKGVLKRTGTFNVSSHHPAWHYCSHSFLGMVCWRMHPLP